MFKKFILFLILSLIFATKVVAASSPSLQQPTNNSTTSDTSPKLSWSYSDSCTTDGSCFLVEVDNNNDFSSPEKSNYTNSTNYTPSLSTGQWFWRVKAKDSSGTWSPNSEVWSFTINTDQVQQPTSTPSPTNNPTNAPTSTPAANTQSFVVSDLPENTNSNSSFTIAVELNHLQANTNFYLKGAFFKNGSTNYFGKTKVNNNWVTNSVSALSQHQITTDSSGSWSGNLEVMPDDEDTGFAGSDNYQFKVGRYNSSGSDLTWSNSTSIHINYIPDPTPNPTSSPSSTTKPTASPKPSSLTSAGGIGGLRSNSAISDDFFPADASIAGIATESAQVSDENPEQMIQNTITENEKSFNWWLIGGGIVVILSSGVFLLKFYQIKLPFFENLYSRIRLMRP